MATHQSHEDEKPSVKRRLIVTGSFSAAYSLTTVSLANLYVWQKEFRNRFVHYSTKTVETIDGRHPVVVAEVPSRSWLRKPRRSIEFPLRTAEDWRSLRTYLATDILYQADQAGRQDKAAAAIQTIEQQTEPTRDRVTETVRRETRISASA